MKFGLMLSNDDPPEVDPRLRVREHVQRAQAAHDAGFSTFACAHRYSLGPAAADARGEPLTTSRFQPLLLLAHLAGIFGDRMNYATTVLLSPSVHPVQLAEDVATLDTLCGGRLRVGVARGWMPYEFEAFGVDAATATDRLEEALVLYRRLLTGEPVTFEGKFFSVTDVRLTARTIQRPAPPLWLGGSAEAAVRRAARLADSWVVSAHSTVTDVQRLDRVYREELERLGRPAPAERPMMRSVYLAPDRETALREARPFLDAWYAKRREWGWTVRNDSDAAEVDDAVFSSGRWLIGSPQDCVEQVQRLRETLGINHLMFALPKLVGQDRRLRTIELLGEHIVSRFSSDTPGGGDAADT